ncbi:MAG: sugar phosphate isomerase/epimerase [Candidatus Hydrogenedentes bacterium]|nr:sugar phosphate isomerase/epimerase [Candidatus Hydrogenedentota bacterium]
MQVGMLTAPFGNESLETVLDFAEDAGIPCLEIIAGPGSKHIDPSKLTPAAAGKILDAVRERGLNISSLAYYANTTDPKNHKQIQEHAKRTIDAASLLGVPTVCMLAGMPVPGLTKHETIKKVCPKVFKPILTHARRKKINIALENWFETNLQGIDTFEHLFEAIPDDNFGLNYDPSHLYHQECDHLVLVSMFAKRIFHTHAKDTLVNKAKRAQVGIYGGGWWRYVIPGFGNINWGEYISHLRQNGYDGVLSIEHEDGTQTREDGFRRGAWYLEQFC